MKTKTMSTFREKLPDYRRTYVCFKKKTARSKYIDSLVQSYGLERKYLIKLLNGSRDYRVHKGRSAHYTESSKKLIAVLWRNAGMPCADYLKPMLEKLCSDYVSLGKPVANEDFGQIQTMSVSTLSRILKKVKISSKHVRNKHSGTYKIKSLIPEMPGSHLPEWKLGTCQIDTVTLCGGNISGSFFSVATLTDALTQWFECSVSWNHSAIDTKRAMERIFRRLPFKVRHLHPDNGSEFINYLFIKRMEELMTGVIISRSRPYHKNDNCRIEQKNGSIVREYFGDIRFDDYSQYEAMEHLCKDIALYTNLFRPCKKLISKQRKDGKGIQYSKRYDLPKTPLERLIAANHEKHQPQIEQYSRLRDNINSIALLHSIHTQLRKLTHKSNPRPEKCEYQ